MNGDIQKVPFSFNCIWKIDGEQKRILLIFSLDLPALKDAKASSRLVISWADMYTLNGHRLSCWIHAFGTYHFVNDGFLAPNALYPKSSGLWIQGPGDSPRLPYNIPLYDSRHRRKQNWTMRS
jgi:hypothetical protein